MNQSNYSYSSIPNDIVLKIASSLEVPDLSSLGCCSRVWRDICGSDFLWESLVKERWHFLYETVKDPNFKDWRGFYIKQHKEKKGQAASVVNLVEYCSQSQCESLESLEVIDYLQAIECLKMVKFGLKDVQLLLLNLNLNVLVNLVGLHYCLNVLQVPAFLIVEALRNNKIADRQVSVKWCKAGRWFYGFRVRGESHSRCVSLEDLATAKDKEVLEVLERGATPEFLQFQISVVSSSSNFRCSQSSQ